MKKIFTVGCAAILSISLLCACNKGKQDLYESPYFFAMAADAAYILPAQFTDSHGGDCNKLYSETRSMLNELDSSLSATIEKSYVTAFNNAAAGAKVELDFNAYEVFSLALDLFEKTEGYYNPAVYYSLLAYGFADSDVDEIATKKPETADELPSDELISKCKQLSDAFGDIELSEENGKYYARKPATEVEIEGVNYTVKIDLGGIGKGYAVDKADALMDEYNVTYGYFTFGSSSIAFRQYIDSDGKYDHNYTLGLSNPRGASQYASIPIKNECLSTSGDNVQYYLVDGKRYCHIIDPTTGKPIQTDIMTATVIGGSAAENDAYTTAIMAMGKDGAVEFIKTHLSDRRVIFAYDGGEGYEIYTNVPNEVKVLESSFTLKVIE